MALMYLLGNPDHYTGHIFIPFWWKSYVSAVMRVWDSESRSDVKGHANSSHFPGDSEECKEDLNSQSHISDVHQLRSDGRLNNNSDKVLIGREDGKYVGTSNVDDYRYRPEVYEAVTLYEWIQMSHRRRATKKEIEALRNPQGSQHLSHSQYFMFKEGHPLQSSHLVKCNTEHLKNVVPNIVGGPLPRYDQGDREYYCCTMLTLFKPWQSGQCLKQPLQLWDDAFHAFNFTDCQKHLMQNFNLRYECLDARDDFHARRKDNVKPCGPWVEHGDTDDEDNSDYVEIESKEIGDHEILGRNYSRHLDMMESISDVLLRSGWLYNEISNIRAPGNRLKPIYLPCTQWANIIKECQDKIFKAKFSGYTPPTPNIDKNNQHTSRPADKLVRVLSADYFQKNFRAEKEESNRVIEATIRKFSLNEEQERAFRIIANHASSVTPEQLRMYLGRMGGTGKSQVIKALIDFFNIQNESHRFIVLAPTGMAAALLNGFTYH